MIDAFEVYGRDCVVERSHIHQFVVEFVKLQALWCLLIPEHQYFGAFGQQVHALSGCIDLKRLDEGIGKFIARSHFNVEI